MYRLELAWVLFNLFHVRIALKKSGKQCETKYKPISNQKMNIPLTMALVPPAYSPMLLSSLK